MGYALVDKATDSVVQTVAEESFSWKGVTFTGVSWFTQAERKNLGIYDHAQKHVETPEGKKQLGFVQEINHEEGIVYEVPQFVDKSSEELAEEKKQETLKKIHELEASVTPRRLREAVLTEEGKQWMETLDSEIAALRKTL